MKTFQKYIFPALFILFVFHLLFRIYTYLPEYTNSFDPGYWEDRYNASQWVISGSKNPIGDDGLYAYASWRYIQGLDPTLLNAEIPPLPKYIIGAGEVIFHNQNILILLIGLATLGVFYLLNNKIFSSKLLAFLPVFVFSFDPLFYTQLRAPYLDTIYLLFLILSLYFLLSKKYILASIFLGCFASTKFPLGSLFLVVPMLLWVILYDKKQINKFIFSLVLWPAVFLLSYIMYFYHGGTFLGLLSVQKWIFYFYSTGAKSIPGIVYPIIFNGTWYTWFSGVQKVSEWIILWPFSFTLSVAAGVLILKKVYRGERKNTGGIFLVFAWVFSYLLFLTITPVFPRYLLLLLPFMYNLSVWFLETSRLKK